MSIEPKDSKKDQSFDQIATEVRELAPHIHPPCPNPAPLGLYAFGLTTALLQVKHTNLGGDSPEDNKGTENLVWGYAIFFGGLLQIIAGIVEIKRNNIFGFTAFSTYGGFWLSLATAHIIVNDEEVLFNSKAVRAMLVLMGIFTFVMWMCTLVMNVTISILSSLLATTFFLLAGGVNNESVDTAAGWIGMATAATAYWLASVELINDIIGKGHEVIPLGRFKLNNNGGGTHVAGRIQSEGHRQALKDTKMGYLRRASINRLSPITTGSDYPKEDERLRLELEDIESGRSQ